MKSILSILSIFLFSLFFTQKGYSNNYIIHKSLDFISYNYEIENSDLSFSFFLNGHFTNIQTEIPHTFLNFVTSTINLDEVQNKNIVETKKKNHTNLNSSHIVLLLFPSFLLIVLFALYVYKSRKRTISLNDKLNAQNASLIKMIETKDRFFGIISHDLKSPFTSIIGISEALRLNYYDFTDEERLEYLKALDESANFTFDLLTNLLMWAKSQTEDLYINRTQYNLEDLLHLGIGSLQLLASRKNIRINHYVSKDQFVTVDRNTLTTAITNLVKNAIKFTPKHGKISITSTETSKSITINIIDNGVGMSEKTIHQILNENSCHSTPGTDNEMGTGLGYILIKKFIELNNGYIEISSNIGEGTHVAITLPKGVAL